MHAQHQRGRPELELAGEASNLVRRFSGDLLKTVAGKTA